MNEPMLLDAAFDALGLSDVISVALEHALNDPSRIWAAIAIILAALFLGVVITYARRPRFGGGPKGLGAFLDFRRLVSPALYRVLYVTVAVSFIGVGILDMVLWGVQMVDLGVDAAQMAAALGIAVVILVAIQVLLRLLFEALLVPFALLNEVGALRVQGGLLAHAVPQAVHAPAHMRADGDDADKATAPSTDPVPARDVIQTATVAMAAAPRQQLDLPDSVGEPTEVDTKTGILPLADDHGGLIWDCSCGAKGNTGAFCSTCKAPCPWL